MSASVNTAGAASTNGASSPHELFALTDEQILEIEPEGEVNVAPPGARPDGVGRAASSQTQPHGAPPSADVAHSPAVILSEPQASEGSQLNTNRGPSELEMPRSATAQAGVPVPQEPPPWLASQMNDPWTGADAKEFWNGVQQSKQEAAAYRAAIATPEEVRALKELYPGGVNDARAAANRARLLDQIDQAYFGASGSTPEQTSAARAQLAAMMLREDPAAFREMVFAGLRALEAAEKGTGASGDVPNLPRLAQVFSSGGADVNVAPPFSAASSATTAQASNQDARLKHADTEALHESRVTSHESPFSAYAAFEKSANEDLERSVGAVIERTLQQALPNLQGRGERAPAGARQGVPLHERLSIAIRQDVEAALKGDRQLGEQIAQILSARRFDNETRAQVVRLIDDRARQLVPSAAKRVINDWTQTTLAAHRGTAARTDVASSRAEVATAVVTQGNVAQGEFASPAPFSSRGAQTRPGANPHRNASRSDSRRLDYRKLSDEQILEL